MLFLQEELNLLLLRWRTRLTGELQERCEEAFHITGIQSRAQYMLKRLLTCCSMLSAISSRLRSSSTSCFKPLFSFTLSLSCSDSSELCCLDSSLTLLTDTDRIHITPAAERGVNKHLTSLT